MKAGAAIIDITPDLGTHLMGFFKDRVADAIHDQLYAKAIVLCSKETTVGFVVCDLVVMPESVADRAKDLIQGRVGIPAENVLICSTHTHTGPAIESAFLTPKDPYYGEWVAQRIFQAFVLGYESLKDARFAYSTGNCFSEVHNRRFHMRDGTVIMNPGYLNPDIVHPAGPVDPEVGFLIMHSRDGQPIAALANLALHYVGTGNPTAISADYFGEFSSALQHRSQNEFVVSMSNGCSGDINNIDPTRPPPPSVSPYFQIRRVGDAVAAQVWEAWKNIPETEFQAKPKIAAQLEPIPFEARVPSVKELEAARVRLEEGPKPTSSDPMDKEWVYAREIIMMGEEVSSRTAPIQAIRIGNLGIVGLPGEAFVEIGLNIKRRSPFRHTMVIGLANAWVGYVATDKALDEGSYETRLCRHVRAPKGTAKLWEETAVRLLERIYHV